MNHAVYGRRLSRSTDERKRLFSGLSRDLFIHGKIRTTVAKAKAVRPMVEKLITRAKKGSSHDYRLVLAALGDGSVAKKLMDDVKTRFSTRNSGYTRIVRLGKRLGDATEEVYLLFVDEVVPSEVVSAPKKATEEKKTNKITEKKPAEKIKKPAKSAK